MRATITGIDDYVNAPKYPGGFGTYVGKSITQNQYLYFKYRNLTTQLFRFGNSLTAYMQVQLVDDDNNNYIVEDDTAGEYHLLYDDQFVYSGMQNASSSDPNYYQKTHYTFGKNTARGTKKLGKESIRMIMINAVIPFLFIYGNMAKDELVKERALAWLKQIPPERNRIVKRWEVTGFVPSSSFQTQGLLQLTTHYCSKKRCLACAVGTSIIRVGVA